MTGEDPKPRPAAPDEPQRLALGGAERPADSSLEFVWTVVIATGEEAEHLERAQAHAIREVLQWAMSQELPSPSDSSGKDPGEPGGAG